MATKPANIVGAVRGIDRDLTGYVIQDEDITQNKRLHRVPDQKDKTAYEEVVENTWNLSCSVISDGASTAAPPLEQNDYFIYPSTGTMGTDKWRWQVDSCKEAGTYNGDRKWTVAAHRSDEWPPQGATPPANGQGGGNG